ncbi:permease for cytosine/purines, uracil, thiamine, allantoin-domain-containing protein [Aspergillus undulatus]|uniref:permease for cytosine/purines, uracil, thiamine, allantoin-domain-containing protein n=1 Tax=Aspergillus undulatus TaxID=1810928 RepID=UPI003CCCEBCA
MARRLLALSSTGVVSTIFPNPLPERSNVPPPVAGHSISLKEYFADCDEALPYDIGNGGNGDPTFLALRVATTFHNVAAGSNLSLSIDWWDHVNNTKPLFPGFPLSEAGLPRVTLFGYIEKFESPVSWRAERALRECYTAKHPDSQVWLPGRPGSPHSSFWAKMVVTNVYWIGGFGGFQQIGWMDIDEWKGIRRKGSLPGIGDGRGWEDLDDEQNSYYRPPSLSSSLRRPEFHLRVAQSQSAFAAGNARWTNLDLDPVPRAARRWGPLSFISYWISDAFNAATWQFASSIIAVGLSWRESLAIVALSFFIISFVIAANGAVGSIYHIPFPVIARASWGFWGSYVAIVSRVILAIFWFAIQNVNGANAVKGMIGAIWPSFLTMRNGIPEEQGISTNTMIAYFVFWLVQFPFLCLSPNRLRWLFLVKSVLVPVAWVAILIWALVAEGKGPLFDQRATVQGVEYSWVWLGSMTSVLGNYATLSVNQSDFSRYSRVSVKWQLLYIPLLPIIFTFISFIGIAASSAGWSRYNTPAIPWDPLELISYWPSRAARFFGAASFALASLGVNISANSISAANDLMALFPTHVNLRRGQIICGLLSWALVPWKILVSAGNFLNFMSAYAIFLGPIAAIMLWDYWLVKGRKYNTLALYQPANPTYRFNDWLVNWRAIVGFLVGVVPSLPGLINSVNSEIDVGVGIRPYQFGWLLGFVGTSAVYVTSSLIWPVHEAQVDRAELADEVYDAREVERPRLMLIKVKI